MVSYEINSEISVSSISAQRNTFFKDPTYNNTNTEKNLQLKKFA